jgi:hypothetical protein
VSSEKRETATEAGGEERRGATPRVAVAAEVRGGYGPLLEPPAIVSRAAKVAITWPSRTPARLSVCDTLLERLPQDLEDMAAALGQLIQEEHAIVGPRHLAQHRHVAPADQAGVRDGVMGGATRAGRDLCHAVADAAGEEVNAHGLNGFGEGHRWQDRSEPVRQHRRARPRGAARTTFRETLQVPLWPPQRR